LKDLSTRIQWPIALYHENKQLIHGAIWKGKYSSSSLKDKVDNANTAAVSVSALLTLSFKEDDDYFPFQIAP